MANNIPGTSGNDILVGTVGDDIINRDGDPLFAPGTRGNDTLSGFEGNDQLYGGAGSDTLNGGAGNDYLAGGEGGDTMNGGNGDDVYEVDNSGDVVYDPDQVGGSGGYDMVISSISYGLGATIEKLLLLGGIYGTGNAKDNEIKSGAGNNVLSGLAGNDLLVSGSGDDLLYGGSGDDHLEGLTGNDQIYGEDGNDLLRGYTGDDVLNGGSGNDHLNGGSGSDLLDGGLGTDTAFYDTAIAGVSVNLSLAGAQNTGGSGFDTLANIENLTGSDFTDTLTGNGANNLLDGGGGTDTASYSTAIAGVIVNLGLTLAQNTVGAGVDTILNIENLTGSNFQDTLTGNGANNVLSGLAGNDRILGGNGNDTLNGDTGNDRLDGGTGNDQLNGGDGSDLLNGGSGADTLIGGFGADTFLLRGAIESQPSSFNRDVITDFAGAGAALGDQINLAEIDANVLVAGNQAFTYIDGKAFTAAGQVRYAGGVLQGSTDADTAAEFEIQLVGAPALFVKGLGTDILL
jgi:Ca2+-binding RTX toxin-like protein